jgi:AraC-like DNA-binding protein
VADLLAALLPAPVAVNATPVIDDSSGAAAHRPRARLTALAAAVGWSPWHLSRIFHQVTDPRSASTADGCACAPC